MDKKEYSREWMTVRKAIKEVLGKEPTDVLIYNWINCGINGIKLPVIRTGGSSYTIYRISPKMVAEWMDEVEAKAREEANDRQEITYVGKYCGKRKLEQARQREADRRAKVAIEALKKI